VNVPVGSGPGVPESLGAIDASWLTEALSSTGLNVEIDSFRCDRIGQGVAFLGALARLSVTYRNGDGPISFVVKIPPSNQGALAVGRLLNVWVREARFYRDLASQLPDAVSVPRCWYQAIDGERSVIVLDDLAPAETRDQVVGATDGEANAAVEALARFQAHWWGQDASGQVKWMPGIDRPNTGIGLATSMAANIDRFVDRFGHLLSDETTDWTRRFIPHVPAWLTELASHPMTVAHADYRLGNLLFGPHGQVHMIDWQTAMRTGGATDLAFFTTTSISIESRRRNEAELLDRYINTLRESGVARSDLAHVRDDYAESILWWMAMLSNNLANIDAPDEKSTALFDSMLTRMHTAASDHDLGRVIDRLERR